MVEIQSFGSLESAHPENDTDLVAHLEEQRFPKAQVEGSSPSGVTHEHQFVKLSELVEDDLTLLDLFRDIERHIPGLRIHADAKINVRLIDKELHLVLSKITLE